tara:strand:+ start:1756 stop:2499 length:744 start_codon:yes stop_codon:yes gene_type:complete
MGALALCTTDLRGMDGQPRILDLRLGEVLGFTSPVDIRKLIRRHVSRLEQHGSLFFATVAKNTSDGRKGRGRPSIEYYLNERQAYRLCMWSEAPNADAVQEQMTEVFYAYRHGQLVSPSYDPWREEMSDLRKNIDELRALVEMHHAWNSPDLSKAITRSPSVFRYTHADGRVRRQRHVKWQHDEAVMEAVVATHRRMTLDDATASLVGRFGPDRAPSRSSLGRFWKNALDPMVGVVARPRLQRVDDK